MLLKLKNRKSTSNLQSRRGTRSQRDFTSAICNLKFVFILLAFLFFPQITHATDVSGIISADTTWSSANSPYIVTGNVLVSDGVTLTVEAGVTIKFDSGKSLQINGTLIARGTVGSKITFTSNQATPTAGDWGNISFADSSVDATFDGSGNYTGGSILEHCVVEYGGSGTGNNGAVKINRAAPLINYCEIKFNNSSGVYAIQNGWSGLLKITNNLIQNNSNGDGGIFLYDYIQTEIKNNIISANSATYGGIYLTSAYDNGNEIVNNIILNNTASTYGGGITLNGGTANISNNNLIENASENGSVIYFEYTDGYVGTSSIKNNQITANKGNNPLIYIGDSSSPLIDYNNIFVNDNSYNVYLGTTSTPVNVNAENNYWGTIVDSEIQALIYDWNDDSSKGIVDYSPYLTEPDTTAPISPPSNLSKTASGGNINLSWDANPESDTAGYKIYYDTDSGFPYANVVDVGNVTSYALTAPSAGTSYYIAVTAYDTTYSTSNDDANTIWDDNQTNGNESWFSTEVQVDQIAPVTTASSPTGTYYAVQTTLTCDDGAGSGCATTYYTTNGSNPTTNSSVYTSPISIDMDTTLKYFSVDNDGNQEAVKTEVYTITPYSWTASTNDNTNFVWDIWGISSTDVFTVGESGDIFHYDGTLWSKMISGTINPLHSVWGSSSNDVFAVGEGGTILHFDGVSWSSIISGITSILYSVWGISSTDVFAVGTSGTILHFDGTSWIEMTSGTTGELSGVWGSSSNDVFAVGEGGTIVHYNGTSWLSITSPSTNSLRSVWGISSTDVFAVGTSGTILHFDGTSWIEMTSGTTDELSGVWGSSSNDVFATGYDGTILHYNGTSWNTMASGITVCGSCYSALYAIWGFINGNEKSVVVAGANRLIKYLYENDVTAPTTTVNPPSGSYYGFNATLSCGDGLGSGCTYTYYTTDGSEPTTASTRYVPPLEITTDTTLKYFSVDNEGNTEAVKTVTYTITPSTWINVNNGFYTEGFWGSSSSDVFAVGQQGGSIFHYDGSSWIAMTHGATGVLYGVWGSSSTDVFAVGESGGIVHYNGTSWAVMSSGTTEWLYSVWGSSSTNVFAVGTNGEILHYDGTSWAFMPSGTTSELIGVWGSSSIDVFAVGGNGTILHYDGTSWTAMTSGNTNPLRSVWGSSSIDVFAVGGNGTILHYDGTSWTAMTSGNTNPLRGVWGSSSTDVFAVGYNGTILHYDGTTWYSVQNKMTASSINTIWGTSSTNVFIGENSIYSFAVNNDSDPPSSSASPAGGTYGSSQLVTLTCGDGDGWGCKTVYYTTDGTTPTVNSNTYSSPLTISSNTTLKYFSTDNANNQETPKSETYVIDTFDPSATITAPANGSSQNSVTSITGTALDDNSGLSTVEIKVFDGTNYLTSSGQFTTNETWITATGTTSWSVNTSNVTWNSGSTYIITARATDAAGNTATSISSFGYIVGSQAYTTLSLDLSSQTILQNETINAVGKLTRLPDNSTDLSGKTITLTITDPNALQTTSTTTTDNSLGHYQFLNISGFTQKGSYTLQTSFAETGTLAASTSEAKSMLVGASAGYAVLLEGKISSEEGLDAHNKTANRIYKTLKKRGFIDQNIFYFNYNTTQTGIEVDASPTKSAIKTAIETWAKDKMNGSPAPLYVILLDHGNRNIFYINNETITPSDLSSWLDTLESGLNGSALAEKRIIVYGACYSGSFIPALSKSNRVIVTSASANEESYKGPLEPDNIRSGSYFLEEFFKELGKGRSLKKSFEKSVDKTEKFTRKGGNSANANNRFFDSAMQHPLLDDNNDSIGSNVLSDSHGDGLIARDLYLGTGVTYDTNSAANPVEINETTETIYLNTSVTSALMWAEANDDSQVDSAVWMEIRPPSKTLAAAGGTNQLTVDLTKEFMTLNSSTAPARWENTYSSFTESGMYEIFYFARDIETKELSPMKRSVVYKSKTGNNAPVTFGLTSPTDSSEQKTVLVFEWNASSDPDGDAITYNLVIATDAQFSNVVYKKEEITTTTTYADSDAGLLDLTTYYWKAQAVDAYGALTDSTETRSFNTNNTNAFPGIITGTIYNSLSFAPVIGASLSTDFGGAAISIGGGVYIMIVPSGTMNITSSSTGYSNASISEVTVNSTETTIVNIPMSPLLITEIEPPTTSISPVEGFYSSSQTIILTCDDGSGSGCAATYYTTDGSNPTASSTQYSSAINVSTPTTIKYFSKDALGNREKMKKADYFIIPTGIATLSVSPTSLAFGTSTTEMNISISNTGGGRMDWSATSDSDWLTIKNSNGLTEGITDQRIVKVDRSGLNAGDYNGTVTIDAGTIGSTTISVTMTVSNSPVLHYAPSQIDFGHLQTQASLNITNKGTGTLNWSVTESLSWLTFDVSSGSTTTEKDTVTMTINRPLPTTGENTGTIDISDGTTTTPITVTAYKPDANTTFTSMTTNPSNLDADGSTTSMITATFSGCASQTVTFSTELGNFSGSSSTTLTADISGVATAIYTASSVEGIAVIMAECNGVYGAGTVNLNNISFINAETEIPDTGDTTIDKKSTTGLSMDKSGFGTPPVTLAIYSFNPGNTFTNVPIGNYFDANLGDTDDVDSVTIKKWVTAEDIAEISGWEKMTLGLYYANGTSWEACSNTGYVASPSGSYVGYIYAVFTDSTTPSIDYLDGLPLVAGEEAVIPIPTLSEWGIIIFTILILLSGLVMLRRKSMF